jgi:hypothetical protein
MRYFVQHILAGALCLLVIAGAVGVNFYLFTCAHCDWQVALEKDIHAESCCGGSKDSEDGEGGEDNNCCHTTQISIRTGNFEITHNAPAPLVFPVLFVFNTSPTNCNNRPLAERFWAADNAALPPPLSALHCPLRL